MNRFNWGAHGMKSINVPVLMVWQHALSVLLDEVMNVGMLIICDIFIIDHVTDDTSCLACAHDDIGVFESLGFPCSEDFLHGKIHVKLGHDLEGSCQNHQRMKWCDLIA